MKKGLMSLVLTDKQHSFCVEYLKDRNGTQAAIRAGYSPKTANEQAARMLAKVHIQDHLRAMQSKSSEKILVSREKVLAQYAKIAFFDVRKFYDEKGKFKNIIDLDDESAAAITGLEIEEKVSQDDEDPDDLVGDPIIRSVTATKKIKFADMKGALDSICRMEGYNMPDKMLTLGKMETVVRYERDSPGNDQAEKTA